VIGSRWQLSKAESVWARRSIWIILAAIGLQVFIQVLWSSIDPFQLETRILDYVDLSSEYTCSSSHITVWACLCIAEIVLLLMWACYVVFDIKAKHEKRWLLINVYNISLMLVVLVPVFVAQVKSTEDVDWSVMLLVLIYVISNLVGVFAPLAIRRRKRATRRKMLLEYVQSGGEGPLTDVKLRNYVKNKAKVKNLW
jgi:hypothetical protein